jgi:hypothetical protein
MNMMNVPLPAVISSKLAAVRSTAPALAIAVVARRAKAVVILDIMMVVAAGTAQRCHAARDQPISSHFRLDGSI